MPILRTEGGASRGKVGDWLGPMCRYAPSRDSCVPGGTRLLHPRHRIPRRTDTFEPGEGRDLPPVGIDGNLDGFIVHTSTGRVIRANYRKGTSTWSGASLKHMMGHARKRNVIARHMSQRLLFTYMGSKYWTQTVAAHAAMRRSSTSRADSLVCSISPLCYHC